MYPERSVSFFKLLSLLDEGDVPRGAMEIKRVRRARKACFLQPA
jgi:hypothetical protein